MLALNDDQLQTVMLAATGLSPEKRSLLLERMRSATVMRAPFYRCRFRGGDKVGIDGLDSVRGVIGLGEFLRLPLDGV